VSDSVVTSEISAPYAQALLSLAKAENLSDRFGEDATSILDLLKDSPDLDQFLASPIISLEAKKAVLQQVLGDQVHPHVRNFLLLVVDHRRVAFLSGILKQYQALLRELNQTSLAEVTSAVPLNEQQQQTVRDRVIALTGARQVDLETTIDPDLIGGVIIKVGSQVIDASLRGQLRRISLRLGGAT
jgi:F-type H+-transporting ATPase subunit delta